MVKRFLISDIFDYFPVQLNAQQPQWHPNLTDRSMRVKYKGVLSDLYLLPGGGPQGTLLGLFLFLVLVNDVGFEGQQNNVGELITSKRRVKELNIFTSNLLMTWH